MDIIKSFLIFTIFLTIFNCKEKYIDDNDDKQLSLNETVDYSFVEIKQIDKDIRTVKIPEFQEGNTKVALIKNAREYYTKYWNEYYEVDEEVPENQNSTNNSDQDIVIVSIQNNFGIVEHSGSEIVYGEKIKRNDIWVFKNDYWQPVVGFDTPNNSIKITRLNNDDYEDIIIFGGCCDVYTYSILLGGKKNKFKLVQEITVLGSASMAFNGTCQKSSILAVPYSALKVESRKLIFNCATNRFE
ncbi:MAG: hypothetical protein ABUK01_08925 [Leptospirales bacterium]